MAVTDYIDGLKAQVCEQVKTFIVKVMKDEYTVDNGYPPAGSALGTGRFGELQDIDDPRHSSPAVNNGTSKLYPLDGEDIGINNNPLYPSNLIHRLNTPFDHLERILLQDFSSVLVNGDNNYFTSSVFFSPSSH